MKLSIVVPIYNEEKTLTRVLERILAIDFGSWEKEVVVVDDGSEDNSKLIAKDIKLRNPHYNLRLVFHDTNKGKGSAIQTGLNHATGDALIIQDADLEYDPTEIGKLLDLYDGEQVVYGSRNINPHKKGYSHYVLGVRILTGLVNLLYRTALTDVYTCYKLFPTNLIKKQELKSQGFEFEMEITCRLLNQGVNIVEVPISYNPRKFSEGKKIRVRDGFVGLWTLFRNWI